MRIAISGPHNTGKSTLVDDLGERLPRYLAVPEPYVLLEEDGYAFAFPPTIEDFVAQLRQSILILQNPAPDLIVDRCPLDFLGYIAAGGGNPHAELQRWQGSIRAAVVSLDVIVSVRIDPVHDPDVEHDPLRRRVDAALWDIVVSDELDMCRDVPVMPLAGPWELRTERVLAEIARMQRASDG